jgi:hypothetical protein
MKIRPARVSDIDEVASGTRLVRHVEAEVERSTRDTEIRVNATRNAEAFYAAIGYERLPVSGSALPLFITMRTQLGR